MKCKFVVGQKVVCIKELRWRTSWEGITEEMPMIKVGNVYTIKNIKPARIIHVLLELQEIGGDNWFEYTVFKPLDERKTDISVFTRMLKQKEMIDG